MIASFRPSKGFKDRVLIATDRLKSAVQLVPLYRDAYLNWLRANAAGAVEIVIEFDDLDGLNTLAELGIFVGENIDQSIELANSAQKPEILSYLMNYKNAHIGISETDYDLRVRRDAVDRQKRAEELAIQILRYARNELLVALRFLDLALCRPEYQPGDLETFALDGEYLSFNPDFIFALYMQGGGELNHSYLHAILH